MDAMRLEHVSKRYGDFLLDDVSITLPKGCIMGFIGENGAGKTTTIKLILDMVKRDGGTIEVLGQECSGKGRKVLEHVGVVLDSAGFSADMTGNEVGKALSGVYRTWDRKKFSRLLSDYHVDGRKRIKEYSKGMKMKLCLAAALAHDSRLLILDEAMSALDPVAREEILEAFQDFILDEDHSIFLSSHIISDLEKISDYITFIHRGRILFSEEKDRLLETYGIFHGDRRSFLELPEGAAAGKRETAFGVDVLVRRDLVPAGARLDAPSLEDIMVYFSREDRS